jgi:hypothetical protein
MAQFYQNEELIHRTAVLARHRSDADAARDGDCVG